MLFPSYIRVGEEIGEICKTLLRQNFMFKSKTCGMYIVDLNIAKALGNMHIRTFFISLARPLSDKGLVTLYKYTRACRCRNLVEIASSTGGNKLINKCYSDR